MAVKGKLPGDSAKAFGQWLASTRKARRLSQEAVAKLAGISRPTLAEYEAGGRTSNQVWRPANPTAISLYGLADALGIEPAEMFERAGVPYDPDVAGGVALKPNTREGEQIISDLMSAVSALTTEVAELRSRLDENQPDGTGKGAPRKRAGA